jgi:hypothetical protein
MMETHNSKIHILNQSIVLFVILNLGILDFHYHNVSTKTYAKTYCLITCDWVFTCYLPCLKCYNEWNVIRRCHLKNGLLGRPAQVPKLKLECGNLGCRAVRAPPRRVSQVCRQVDIRIRDGRGGPCETRQQPLPKVQLEIK